MKSSIIKTGAMLAGFLLAACLSTHAEVKLPAIFSDGMVMQQQTNANLWGTATPYKKVTVTTSWNGKQYAATADKNGAWKLTVATPEAGGPYTVTFDDGTQKTLNNILIGELWLCSGQSNMEMPMKGFKNQPVENANMDILHSKNPQIRLFTVKRTSTFTPQNDVIGSWKEATPVNVRDFSATAYYFGRLVNEILDVPVGLVVAAWGGSACEAWMTADWLKAFPEAKIPQTETDIKSKNRTPTVLYNGMLHPLIGMTMKGSDAGHNGLKHIAAILGTQNYARLRFGIGNDFPKGGQVDYVLGHFTDEDLKTMNERLETAGEIIKSFCLAGIDITMNQFNKK